MIARAERQCYQGLDEPVERGLSVAFEASCGGRVILEDRVAGGSGSLQSGRELS